MGIPVCLMCRAVWHPPSHGQRACGVPSPMCIGVCLPMEVPFPMERMDRSHLSHMQGTNEGAKVPMRSSLQQGPVECLGEHPVPKMLDPDGIPKAGGDGGPPSSHLGCPGVLPWHSPSMARLGCSSLPLVSGNIPLAEL